MLRLAAWKYVIVPQAPGAFESFVNEPREPLGYARGHDSEAGSLQSFARTEPPEIYCFAAAKNPWDLLELLPGYRLAARAREKSENTIKHVDLSVRIFYRFLSIAVYRPISGLSPSIIFGVMRYISETRSASATIAWYPSSRGHLSEYTVNNYLRGFQSYCAWLRRDEILDVKLFDIYRIAKPPERLLTILTPEQVEAMIKAASGNGAMAFRDRLLILILYDNGIRASELCELEVDNVFLDRHLTPGIEPREGSGTKYRLAPGRPRNCGNG